MSYLFSNEIQYQQDSGTLDAFGRLRISSPYTMFSDRGYYDNQLLYSSKTGGAGGITSVASANSSEIDLHVSTAAGDFAYRQTRMRAVYQPGKSLQIMMSYKMDQKSSLRSRIGYFDTEDGVFLEQDGFNVAFVIRDKGNGMVVEDRVLQANWNMDKMDGTGPSGVTMDFTKAQILFMDLEWLGVGSVRVGFMIGGKIHYVHKFLHANQTEGTYMGHAALPIRAEIQNLGATPSNSYLRMICQVVNSEGGYNLAGTYMSADSGDTPVNVSGNGGFVPILTIRMKPGMTNALVKPAFAPLLNTTNTFGQYKIILNGTLDATTWNDKTDLVQTNTDATTITGGYEVATGYFSNKEGGSINLYSNKIGMGFDIDGNPDTFTLAVKPVSNSNSVLAAMMWTEFY